MGSLASKALFWFYSAGWSLALPILRLNPRLKDGYDGRVGRASIPDADIWIQAASGGEAYLAWELVGGLTRRPGLSILLTTNTRQGMDVLQQSVGALNDPAVAQAVRMAFFPFDHPRIMDSMLKAARPRIIVLLESEIWPGLLRAARKVGCPTIIVNGRMTERSWRRYNLYPSIWRSLRPNRILAISPEDAERFGQLFDTSITVMANIKFDRLRLAPQVDSGSRPLPGIIPQHAAFIVLGSVRKEEEPDIIKILALLHRKTPRTVIGLVPRHMHRLETWQRLLADQSAPWVLRSGIKQPVSEGTVILWDTFGELDKAYSRCDAAFVGGSLAPLGGQNFLEPLMWAVTPVIGPHWHNFAWVGPEIFQRNLVLVGDDWAAVAEKLTAQIDTPPDKRRIHREISGYLEERQGGTQMACEQILELMNGSGVHRPS